MRNYLFILLLLLSTTKLFAQISITKAVGWLESAYITWSPVEGADSYNVYYSGEGITDRKVDTQLVRSYGSYFRADVLGLKSGNYTLKVVPVVNNEEGNAAVSNSVTVLSHDRTGFAHSNNRVPGAYNLDGTLKSNAVVVYVTQQNKNTVSMDVTGANSNPCVGLQNILDGFKKGKDTRPLVVRLIGNVTSFDYMLNGDLVIENKNTDASSITFEGVGEDAVANGWGVRIKNATNVEIRNLGFMLTTAAEGDNISLQQNNSYVWIHNNDLFYGMPGSDSDQAKGDGALDVKKSSFVTLSYNHFWDSGKACLLGLSEGSSSDLFITYHHNWFDHSDSRHPRVRFYSAHVYNNYYDGNSKYGVGSTMGSSIFVEGNYFRKAKYPMLISKQGTDIAGGSTGTFSNENGGIIKAYNNHIEGQTAFVPYHATAAPVHFDAYVANNRSEVLGSGVSALKGGATYNNFDTNPNYYINSLTIDDPVTARDKTMLYSGRVEGGDISWQFNNDVDDTSYAVNQGLMALLQGYMTKLIFVQGETPVSTSSQTLTIPSNNDQTIIVGNNITPMVFTWGGTATDVTVEGLPFGGIEFVKDLANKTVTISGTPTEDVNFTVTTSGDSGTPVSGSGNVSVVTSSEGDMIHNFTESGLNSNFYTFKSANMNSNNGSATYDGLVFTRRLKIETPTEISYVTTEESTLTLVFDPTFNGVVKFNNVNYTATGGLVIIPGIEAGAHKITKGGTTNLFYIKTTYDNLSVKNVQLEQVEVYPNPVVDVMNISNLKNSTIQNITITNIAGQVVKTLKGNSKKISLTDLSSGIYILQIETNNSVITKKIIKK